MVALLQRFGHRSLAIETSISSDVGSLLSRIDDLSRRIKDTVMTPTQTIIEPLEEVEDSTPFAEVLSGSVANNSETRQVLFNWLTNLKLEGYYSVLLDAGYDDLDHMVAQVRSSIPLTDQVLQYIGINKLGHRLRLLTGLELEREAKSNSKFCACAVEVSNSHTFQSLREWLTDQGLPQLTESLEAAGFEDLGLLFVQMNSVRPVTSEMLEEAGVTTAQERDALLQSLVRDSAGVGQYRRYIPELKLEREHLQSSCQGCSAM